MTDQAKTAIMALNFAEAHPNKKTSPDKKSSPDKKTISTRRD